MSQRDYKLFVLLRCQIKTILTDIDFRPNPPLSAFVMWF